jgi:hypothetical protein
MDDLERDLRRLGEDWPWPPTPDFARTVRAAVAGEPQEGRRRRRRLPSLSLAAEPLRVAAVLALLLVVVVAVVPPARSAVLRVLGIKGARITEVPRLPDRLPRREQLRLGPSVALGEAARAVGFRIRVPRAPGRPVDVRFTRSIGGGAVTLVYPTSPELPPTRPDRSVGLLLTQFRGASLPFLDKTVTPGTRVTRVRVDGRPGVWLAGGVHVLVARDRRGIIRPGGTALVHGHVLLWDRGDIAFRIETSAPLRQALRVARSVP